MNRTLAVRASSGIADALRRIRTDGVVEIPLADVPGPVGQWLDALLDRAADEGRELTWTTRGDLLCVVDMEA